MILEYRGNIVVVPHVAFIEVDKSRQKVYIKHTQDKQQLEFNSSSELEDFVEKLKKSINEYHRAVQYN